MLSPIDYLFMIQMVLRGLFLSWMFIGLLLTSRGQEEKPYSFTWGNTTYINLALGEKVQFEENELELLRLDNHWNHLRVNMDTSWLKVSYRSPAVSIGKLRIFIADNRNVRAISSNKEVHGLLVKDALVAVSPSNQPVIDRWQFTFPVSFTDGYLWKNNEDSYMFSYQGAGIPKPGKFPLYPGVGLDIPGARMTGKNIILAVEGGRVVWTETRLPGSEQPKAAVCVESRSTPGIYYIYRNLYNKQIFVSKNQKIETGDPIGSMWGDGNIENVQITVVKNDTIPLPGNCDRNIVNFYPQLLELYYGKQPANRQLFRKGQISFGKPAGKPGNVKNVAAFEEYLGTGWILGRWNTVDKVAWVSTRQAGNARLSQTLFRGQNAQCSNPGKWYDYEINVPDGVFRIRASVGDCLSPSWQKIDFEGINAGTYDLGKGEFTWTPEKIVRVTDGRLTVRIHTPGENGVAGISEIVFMQAN